MPDKDGDEVVSTAQVSLTDHQKSSKAFDKAMDNILHTILRRLVWLIWL